MEIASYKKKGGNVYEVVFDNGDKHRIYDDVILEYELLIDKKLDKRKLDKVLSDNATLDAYYKALKYISIKMRTKLEIEKYLKNKEFTWDKIVYAVDRLEKEGYLNQERYIKAFVNDQLTLTLNGPKKIVDSLKKLGIEISEDDDVIASITPDVWEERIKKVLDKRAKVNKNSDKMFRSKVSSELIILGYPTETVRFMVSNYELDTNDAFLKEAEKNYSKLSSKYDGVELELHFKNKMFSKGFDGDMIREFLDTKKNN